MLTRIAGDALGAVENEQVTGHVSSVQFAMSWQWRLPADTSESHRRKIIAEARRTLVLERWPTLSLPLLGGKTPAEAAGDPANRIRLLGAILLLEVSDAQPGLTATYDELRQKLGLPVPPPIEPSSADMRRISLVRLPRLIIDKLSDDQLREVFHRVLAANYQPAIKAIATEIIRRPNPELTDYKLAAYRSLVQLEEDPDQALELVETARKLAEQARRSTAPWDLEELNLRIVREEGQRVVELITHLRNEHGREPGVGEALMSIFARLGMVGPDGRVRIPTTEAAARGLSYPAPNRHKAKSGLPDADCRPAKSPDCGCRSRGQGSKFEVQGSNVLHPVNRLPESGSFPLRLFTPHSHSAFRIPHSALDIPMDLDLWHMTRAFLNWRGAAKGLSSLTPWSAASSQGAGEVIGEGWHRRFGGPHAEVEALKVAGKRAAAATLYVTLEPCRHYGKTPPCTQAIVAAGVQRVVCAMQDPFPAVSGRGIAELQAAGIRVDTGMLEADARAPMRLISSCWPRIGRG